MTATPNHRPKPSRPTSLDTDAAAGSTSAAQRRRHDRKVQAEAQRRRRLLWQLTLVATAAIVLVGGFVAYSQLSGSGNDAAAIDYTAIPSDGMILGAADAPVTLVEYGDYRCIHCADFTVDVVPSLVQDFVTAGTLRYEFRPLPILGGVPVDDPANPSVIAAESAMCAADQGAFWPYHDRLMAAFRSQHAMGEDQFRAAASGAGIDADAVMACVSAGTHRQAVIDAYTEGTGRGLSTTPSLFLNGTAIVWTGDYAILKKQIEATAGQ